MTKKSEELKGKKYFLEGKLSASVSAFTEALSKDPGALGARLGRGAAQLKLGKFDQAVEDLTAVLEGGGDCEKAYFLRGVAYMNKGEFVNALDDFNRTLEYNEYRAAAILARGMVLANLDRLEEAHQDITSPYVKDSVVIDEFLEEYAIAESLFNQLFDLLNDETSLWNLVLTEDEITRMEAKSF